MSLYNSKIRWIFLTGLVIFFDLFSKWLASKMLIYSKSIIIFPFLHLTLLYNYGIAFGFLNNSNNKWQVLFLTTIAIIISIGIIIWLLRLPVNNNNNNNTLISNGLICMLGGTLGNLYNRLTYGYVIDFLDFCIYKYHWPIFNIADLAICIGSATVIINNAIRCNKNRLNN